MLNNRKGVRGYALKVLRAQVGTSAPRRQALPAKPPKPPEGRSVDCTKYKVRRIRTPNTLVRGKKYLTQEEAQKLLSSDDLIIEEKLDGKLCLFPAEEHEGIIILCEELLTTHTLQYRHLPARRYAFDACDTRTKKLLPPDEKTEIFLEEGELPARIVQTGSTSIPELEKMLYTTTSAFKSTLNPLMQEALKKNPAPDLKIPPLKNPVEGFVLKSYKNQSIGKIVNPFFEEIIDHLGRYEKYPARNHIIAYSKQEYTNYLTSLQQKIEEAGYSLNLTTPKIKEAYKKYLNNMFKSLC